MQALVVQNHDGPEHVAPTVDPVAVPLWHECDPAHQPQPECAAHVPQSVFETHGSAIQAVVVQNQVAPEQVGPMLDPVELPDWHAPVAEHQPHPPRAEHEAQSVLEEHASGGIMHAPAVQTWPAAHALPHVPQFAGSV